MRCRRIKGRFLNFSKIVFLPPKKYSQYSLLFGRVFALFDTLEDKYHNAGFDNLHNTSWFVQASYDYKMKMLSHGVTRKGGRRIISCVQQEELTK